MPKLSKRTVDAIRPDRDGYERPDRKGREVFVWDTGDGALKGFGVRMMPSGAGSYFVQYRTKEGPTRRLMIGKVGVLTPDEARKLAGDNLKEVAKGGDPSTERHRARREALTIAELANLYFAEGPAAKPNKKASSWATDRSNIERHVKPLLGRKLAASLTHDDVVKFQRDVAAGKSKADIKTRTRGRAIVDGGPGTAARSLAVLGAMLEWAARPDRKLIPANPAKGVKLLKGGKRERFLSEAELGRLADVLASMEAEHRLSPTAAAAIRLLLLSGCRKSEILSLRWEWVDVERGVLRLPDSKTGAKVVPLAAAAVSLLAELPRPGEYVLPAAKGSGHYSGLQKDWERVRGRAGLVGVRVHDLRHSFASFAVADGNSLYLIGKVLGHKQARTTEIYAHLADDPIRAVADRTAARIAAAMSPPDRGDPRKVVPIRGGRS
jgi:integrase